MKHFKVRNVFKFPFGIKYKLLLSYVIIIIIPVFIGAYFPYAYTEKIVVESTTESLRFSLDIIVELIRYKMEKYTEFSNKISDDVSIREYITADYTNNEGAAYSAARDIFYKFTKERRSNNGEILNIKIYKNNDTLPSYGDFLLDEKQYKNTEWYKGVSNNKGVSYWKDGIIKSFERKEIKTISLVSRLAPSYSAGLLEIELSEDKILDNIYNFNYKVDSMIGVIDEKGKVIASNAVEDAGFENLLPQFLEKILETDIESFIEGINGEDYLIINKTLNFQGWKVVAMVPMRDLHETTDTIKLVTVVTAISCIVVFLSITVLLSNLMTRRLDKLIRHMRSVKEGNFDVSMGIKGHDEISELSRVFNSMVESIRNLIDEVYKSKIEKKEAELRALQEQINPHFLYNTLSSINWMAVQANAPKIVDIVDALATFYRLSLSKGNEEISLKEEIAQVMAYVAIQKIRYENSFTAYFDIHPDVEEARVIKFIIQPFVENAIIHGFSEEMQGVINITASPMNKNNILIRVIDNGKGIDIEEIKNLSFGKGSKNFSSGRGRGYGIKNVNDRIKLHYGDEYGVEISGRVGEGTVVEIKLPFVQKDKEES